MSSEDYNKFVSVEEAAKSPRAFNIQEIEDIASRLKSLEEKEKNIREVLDNSSLQLRDLDRSAKNVQFAVSIGQIILVGVVIVFFVAFLTFVLDAWDLHRNEYKEYRKTLNSIEEKIKITNNSDMQKQIVDAQKDVESVRVQGQLKNLQTQIDQIKSEIENLWKNKYPVRR